jgi:hypothetical protein
MRSLVLGVLLLTADVVCAEPGTAVLGMGQVSCGSMIAAARNGPPGQYRTMDTKSGLFVEEFTRFQEWLMGFVSGFNATHNNDLSLQITSIDLPGLDLWMRNWCNKNPTKTVFQGAAAFLEEHTPVEPKPK